MSVEQMILDYIDDQDEKLNYVATEIWSNPEIALQETFACRLMSSELEAAGFSIERGVGQMPTSFVASWGEGRPIIGILGEYDALPGLSQKVDSTHNPVEVEGPGHGCGHNLFGTACLGAALSLRNAMEAHNIPGTIRYYGCPAEETLVGKTYMAADGVFDDLDAALCWHPSDSNTIWTSSALAMNSFKVNFHGVSAHAGVDPHNGRSALDGVMLMDVGMNYLREHVIPQAYIHSVITSGGQAPNVVPAFAQVWYFIRAPRRDQVDAIYERVLDIAKGAALMSGTTHEIDFLTGCYDYLSNHAIADNLLKNMQKVGGYRFTPQEIDFAKQLQATFPPTAVKSAFDHTVRSTSNQIDPTMIDNPLWEEVLVPATHNGPGLGSTEVGDVSHITPTGQINTTCWPLGTPGHSWQITASSGSSIGTKGMMLAAKTLALTGLDLLTQPELLAAAQAEFKQVKAGQPYVSPLPKGAVPK